MTTEKMRAAIEQVYAGPTWRLRVQAMDDRQVVAIYKSMKEEGRLDSSKEGSRTKLKDNSQQITIWDILNEKSKE